MQTSWYALLGSTSLNLALAKKSGDMQDERLTGYMNIRTLEINKRISKAWDECKNKDWLRMISLQGPS